MGFTSSARINADVAVVRNTAPKIFGSGNVSNSPATFPPTKLPSESERNQTPIIEPTSRVGASLVTVERPTGLRLNSPMVWKKDTATSHQKLTGPLCEAIHAAMATTRNPRPRLKRPRANFAGLEGSRRPGRGHNKED